MTKKSYHWKFMPMDESDPYDVFTDVDSIVAAVKQFERIWGQVSISSVQKVAETIHFEHEEVS